MNTRTKQRKETYFETLNQAVEYAKTDAIEKGYEVTEGKYFKGEATLYFLDGINYGQTDHFSIELKKDGKELRKRLQLVIYRMDSGRYELTHYIN